MQILKGVPGSEKAVSVSDWKAFLTSGAESTRYMVNMSFTPYIIMQAKYLAPLCQLCGGRKSHTIAGLAQISAEILQGQQWNKQATVLSVNHYLCSV